MIFLKSIGTTFLIIVFVIFVVATMYLGYIVAIGLLIGAVMFITYTIFKLFSHQQAEL